MSENEDPIAELGSGKGIQAAIDPTLNAAGHLRVSNASALWDNKNIHDRNVSLWEEPQEGVVLVYVNIANGPFQVGESVTGATSGAVGEVTSLGAGSVTVSINHNTFIDSEQIAGGVSTATADIVSSNTGTTIVHNRNEASVILKPGTAAGDKVVRHTHRYFSYVSAKPQRIDVSFVFGPPVANVIKRVGYFDDLNGLFIEQDGPDLYLVRRTNVTGTPTDIKVHQTNGELSTDEVSVWNVDKFDGKGLSGVTFDVNKTRILTIDFQWLAAGLVRYGFGVRDNIIAYAHAELFGDTLDLPFMSTPSLPIRYEIFNTAVTAGTAVLREICNAVVSEGGEMLNGLGFAKSNDSTGIAVTQALKPLILLRPKNNFGSDPTGPNRKTGELNFFGAFAVGKDCHIEVKHVHSSNSIDGAWISVGDSSAFEYNVTATTLGVGEAHTIAEDYIASGGGSRAAPAERKNTARNNQHRFITQNTDSTDGECFAIVGASLDPAGALMYSQLEWTEFD
ncbi:hypothetical protein KAR91_33335 [Candidatus Pacearchaeota archaeon]|nr:hypothetical protein [Candidatus Pacearchaeota archaeon]